MIKIISEILHLKILWEDEIVGWHHLMSSVMT